MIKSLYKQATEPWFQEKTGKITGTRFEALMMGEGTKGYNGLIADLAGEILTGEMDSTFKNKLMEEAAEMEHEAVPHLADIIGPMEEVGFMMREEDDPYHEWIGLSPDRLLIDERKYVEVKCPLKKTHLSYFRGGFGEKEYRWQLQGGLWTMQEDYDSVYFCSYFPNLKPYINEVFPDEKDFKKIDERIVVTVERVEELIENYKKSDEYELG